MRAERLKDCDENLIDSVICAAINVHRELGPGLLESVYEHALMLELADMGMEVKRQVEIPAFYKGKKLGLGFRADIIVKDCLLLEIKAAQEISAVHLSQVITYLKLLGFKRGFIFNFNCKLMKETQVD